MSDDESDGDSNPRCARCSLELDGLGPNPVMTVSGALYTTDELPLCVDCLHEFIDWWDGETRLR